MSKNILSDKESLVKKASYLRIIASDLANNMKSGNFKSLYKGQGIELAGVRDYIPGDDIRSFDWNVTARMGRPYVKIFNEERELQIFIIIDSSASMHLSHLSHLANSKIGSSKTKYDTAAEAAAILTIASEINNCPVGAVFFDGKVNFSYKPVLSKAQTMKIITHLDKISHEKAGTIPGTALGAALTGAAKLLKNRSLVFVFSDFRSDDWEKPIISLAHKNDVIAFRMHDKNDEEMPKMGTVVFQDVESGIKMNLPSSSQKFQKAWKKFDEDNIDFWADFCRKHGVVPVLFDTAEEPLFVLNSVMGRR